MGIREQMDAIYGKSPLEKIPWNLTEPPALLVDLVDSGRVRPCRAVDLGCGAGNYAVWLASQGFEMTGLDISAPAVAHAEALAASRKVSCRFRAADMLDGPDEAFEGSFDFAYDWEVLHHVPFADRPRYAAHVHRMLRDGATYLSVCFSETDETFPGTGKVRTTPLGTELYLSSEDDIRSLFEPLFTIRELKTVEVAGKYQPHPAVVARLQKRNS